MFRLSKLTDYAVVVMVRLSRKAELQTVPCIAATTGIPEPTVAKVLKLLAAGGMVSSQRGARGGYRLGRPLAAIAVAEVIESVDGPIALTSCVDGGGCDSATLCPMHGRWDPVNAAIRAALGGITLADMAASMPRAFADAAMVTTIREAAPASRVSASSRQHALASARPRVNASAHKD
jgi:FeS assembly SUF system regulator